MFELPLIVAIIMALVESTKKIGIPARFAPLTSLILGLGAGFVYVDGDIKTQLFYGVAIGLAAAGLFDMTKVPRKDK